MELFPHIQIFQLIKDIFFIFLSYVGSQIYIIKKTTPILYETSSWSGDYVVIPRWQNACQDNGNGNAAYN